MITELIERLRTASMATLTRQLCQEAADEVERLTAELKQANAEIEQHKREYTIVVDAWNREIDRNQALSALEVTDDE